MNFFWRNIKDVKGLAISVVIVILILIFVFILKSNSGNWIVKDCEGQRQKEIRGKVDTAFFDSDINVKSFVIVFENGERYSNPIYLKSLNGFVKKGDSIYKPTGRFTFYRHENFKWIEIMNQDTLICSELYKNSN
jgi:hypothetical protein